jgi:hypothetical protein
VALLSRHCQCHLKLHALAELDYARAMAFVAIDEASSEMLGVVWLYSEELWHQAEKILNEGLAHEPVILPG